MPNRLRMSNPTIPTLVHRVAVATRERDEALATIATLRAELAASMLRYTGHSVSDDGRLVTLHSGERYEYVGTGEFTTDSTSYGNAWKPLPPVPGSPAVRLAAVLASDEAPARAVRAG
jgi:hypothetical protein